MGDTVVVTDVRLATHLVLDSIEEKPLALFVALASGALMLFPPPPPLPPPPSFSLPPLHSFAVLIHFLSCLLSFLIRHSSLFSCPSCLVLPLLPFRQNSLLHCHNGYRLYRQVDSEGFMGEGECQGR